MADNKSRESIGEKASALGEMTMKLSLDVSEALTGLKAVQREAKEAAKALRELESTQRIYIPFDDENTTTISDAELKARLEALAELLNRYHRP